jgi:ABC-2 type transport system ATP-binding protein
MEEADTLCDRIGFINKGKIIAIDTPQQLKLMVKNNNDFNNTDKYIGDIVKLHFKVTKQINSQNNNNNNILTKNIEILKSFKFVKKVEQINESENDDLVLILHVDNMNYNLPIILKSIDKVEYIEFSQPTLDDVFYTFTKGRIAEEPEGGFMERYAQYDKK